MKILTVEVMTDAGRRVVKLGAPLDVDPIGDMPLQFRALTEVLWGLVREMAAQQPAPTTPNAEA